MSKISLDPNSPRTNFILGAAVSGGDVKVATNAVAYCRLCDQDGHVPGKECYCCCSNCGGEKDSTGYCPNYCMDEEKDTGAGPQRNRSGCTLYCPRGCCDQE